MTWFTRWESERLVAQYLDDTLLNLPPLAVEALYKELERYGNMINHRAILRFELLKWKKVLLPGCNDVDILREIITKFIHKLSKSTMSLETATQLEKCLTLFHDYDTCYNDLRDITTDHKRYDLLDTTIRTKIYEFLDLGTLIYEQTDPKSEKFVHINKAQEKVLITVHDYIKNILLDAVSKGILDIYDMEHVLNDVHLIRSSIVALDKASRLLDRTAQVKKD